MANFRLQIVGTKFRDQHSREITIHGLNVAADAKLPARPDQPSHIGDDFFDGDDVSFVGRPFPVTDAHTHFGRIKRWGYNTIRYVFTWEAIEAAGPGKYDEEWIRHTISVLRVAKQYGFYVFMDPHQDVWSRFSGGSGAPMWTLYACGLDPRKFGPTEAAIVQNTYDEPAKFPKMIWATNYTRLACLVAFTLFFGGRDFAPKAILNGQNIQDYLQDHFIGACKHLAQRIHEAGDLENEVVIGWESLNEPSRGLIGFQDLSIFPPEQKLRKGTSPTAWQAILTGSGRACEVETWDFGTMGPYKVSSILVDPSGQTAWLSTDHDDTRYGWNRHPEWKLGECIWAQHGVWNPIENVLLRNDYFAKNPRTNETIDHQHFTNHYFMDLYRKYSSAIKSVFPESFMFCQPPVLEIPPSLAGTEDDDPNIVFAPHFYDGLTLLTKKWNRLWNVDVFGILRGKYTSPVFAIRIGEAAIRNSFREQLSAIREEAIEYMGNHPCVFTEIGIPFDMDDQHAYKTGDYSSQVSAMDVNHFAIEGSKAAGFTLWAYVATNNHQWGDRWNGEDLSIYSVDDNPLPTSSTSSMNASTTSLDPASPSYSQSQLSEVASVSPSNLKQTLASSSMTFNAASGDASLTRKLGYRAAEAFVRPTPIATHGDIVKFGFDLRNCTFTLALTAASKTRQEAPTEVFLPDFHFPPGRIAVEVSGGKWQVSSENIAGSHFQLLKWWHAEGEQTITVRGLKRKHGVPLSDEEEEGYLEQCQQRDCGMM